MYHTFAPVDPRAIAIALPIPRDAPVTTQTGVSTKRELVLKRSSKCVLFVPVVASSVWIEVEAKIVPERVDRDCLQ